MTIKLNVGCGDKLVDGDEWLNVDCRKIYPETASFLRHDILRLKEKFRDDTADEILLSDVIEHFWKPDGEKLMQDCRDILKRGGLMTIKTPEIGLLLEYSKNRCHMDVAHRWYGGQEYSTNVHMFVWPKKQLIEFIEKVLKLKVKSVITKESTNIEIEAVKI